MKKSELIEFLAARPLVTISELRNAGAYRKQMATMGEIAGISHFEVDSGIYANDEAFSHPRFEDALAFLATGGVIARYWAAARHGDLINSLIMDSSPIEVLVDHSVVRHNSRLNIQLLRTRRPELLSVGVEYEDISGVMVPMTSKARTAIDILTVDRTKGIEAVSNYLEAGGDGNELQEVGDALDVRDVLDPIVDALNSRGLSY